jgi:N-acetylglucosaminyldiphosphoundecaprenol N-acetyl-beta-D-mannosaminyltransferase
MASRVTILGIGIDALTMDGAIAAFERLIKAGQPALACNLNVHLCMQAREDAELRSIYLASDLVLVDGTPMMWAAQYLGSPLPGRVSGSDLVPAFCRVAAQMGYRIFLLGGAPGVADRAKCWLESRNPGLKIVGTYAPPMGFEQVAQENAHIVAMVTHAKPDVLFAALGPGKQEKWLYRFRTELRVSVSMGIGSSFDDLAGRLKRAPMWMQKAGLEWTFRLAQEPRRLWHRYLIEDPPFVYHVIKQRFDSSAASAISSNKPFVP